MKKFWIVMLVAGLFLAFTAPAIAAVSGADVQFSGTYRARGWYDDNINLLNNDAAYLGTARGLNKGQAFYDNRLRVETTFKVAEGLKLVTRFDALEKKWGQDTYASTQAGRENGNIFFERAYVSFTTGLGTLNVGYQDWSRFGTQFIDSDQTFPGIKYINSFGPLTVLAGVQKRSESRETQTVLGNQAYNSGYMDIDSDMYILGAIFKFKGGDAGVLYEFLNDRSNSQNPTQAATTIDYYRMTAHIVDAYAKYKVGPVYVEAEGYVMAGGMYRDYTKLAPTKNRSLETYGVYLNAEVDLKPAYVGGKYVYTQGDDSAPTDESYRGSMNQVLGLGTDHDFALMIGNYEYFNQVTGGTGWMPNPAATNSRPSVSWGLDNINAWQIYVGVKPTPKIDVRVAVTDAYTQTLPRPDWVAGKHIGTEIDLRATYRIFDNLTYTVGAGYLFTGNYFGGSPTNVREAGNNYLLMHQLLLSF